MAYSKADKLMLSNNLKIWLGVAGGLIVIAGLAFALSWKAHWDIYNPKQYNLTDPYIKQQYEKLLTADQTLKDSFNYDAAVSRANALMNLGKTSAAVRAWGYFNQNRPNGIQGYWGLAQIYTSQSKFGLAETNWLKAIEVDKSAKYANSYIGLNDLYKNSVPENRYKIVQLVTQAIAANPTEPNYPLILANYYEDAGDLKSALEFYRKAVSLNPSGSKNLKTKIAELEQKV